MKIAIVSDSHDNFHNLTLFFNDVVNHNVEKILFLGDFINAGIAKHFAHFQIPTFAIFGNNDGELVGITKVALKEGSNLEVGFSTFDILEIDGRKLFLTHYPILARPMAKSKDFDAVFYGHNHLKHQEMIGNCLMLNPGEISAHKTKIASYAVYDTKTNSAQIYELNDSITVKTDKVVEFREKNKLNNNSEKHHQV